MSKHNRTGGLTQPPQPAEGCQPSPPAGAPLGLSAVAEIAAAAGAALPEQPPPGSIVGVVWREDATAELELDDGRRVTAPPRAALGFLDMLVNAGAIDVPPSLGTRYVRRASRDASGRPAVAFVEVGR